MSETDRFDALLMNIAQTQRGIEPLLDTVFSFLRRKTDFFSGATPEVIEETILKCVRKQAILAEKAQFHKKQQEEEKRKKRLAEEALKKKKKEEADRARAAAAVPAVEPPRFEEITDEDEQAPEQKVAASGEAEGKNEGGAGSAPEEGGDEEDDGAGKVLVQSLSPPATSTNTHAMFSYSAAPVGNGGQTDKYVWTQTLQEAQANFAVPDGTKSRQVVVDISSSKLKVGLKGGETFVDGLLFKKVKVDDSFWTLEDGNRICVYLQKENQMEWWKTIIQGDAEIDTKKVQPENSKLADLDSDTRQTVEKMMFDQKQKALGLPTSDDIQKQDVLKKFMAQHPEMDFSNAKIN